MRGRQAKPFYSYVRKTSSCWFWTGAKASNGYGNIRRNGRNTSTHQFAYEMEHGSVPEGMELLHWCDNKLCVRVAPGHVQVGSHMENVRDCVSKGNHAHGESHGKSVLSGRQVRSIRRKYAKGTVTQRELAAEYGVVQSAISKIVTGSHWRVT